MERCGCGVAGPYDVRGRGAAAAAAECGAPAGGHAALPERRHRPAAQVLEVADGEEHLSLDRELELGEPVRRAAERAEGVARARSR